MCVQEQAELELGHGVTAAVGINGYKSSTLLATSSSVRSRCQGLAKRLVVQGSYGDLSKPLLAMWPLVVGRM
ncbi:unnamed protein product [Ixodes pacificus]